MFGWNKDDLKEDIDSCQFYIPEETLDEEGNLQSALRYGIKIPQMLKNPNQ